MNPKPNIFARLREMPNVHVRSEPQPTLEAIVQPKPEVQQVEPMAIPDVVHFEPMVVLPSNVGPGYYIEIDDAKHYGATPLEALGQAVLNGAFGALNIVIP